MRTRLTFETRDKDVRWMSEMKRDERTTSKMKTMYSDDAA